MRGLCVRAEAATAILFVVLVIALEPHDVAVTLKREDVGGYAIEEPAIMAYNYRTPSEMYERLL
jgi:hypothetical protein